MASCSRQQSTSLWKSGISEPFENITIGCNGNEIDAEKGGEIFFASGTKLYIPPNAFVDKDGQPVNGKVTVNYREFHSPAEIMVSGIPMKYNNNGTEEDFESAGMFEITANAGGASLELAPGKEIDMWLASDKSDDNYNFYRFDTANNAWVEVSTASQQVMSNPDAVVQSPEGAVNTALREPVAPQLIDKSQPVFEFTPDVTSNQLGEVDDLAIRLWQVESYNRLTAQELDVLSNPKSWDKHLLRPLTPSEGTYELLIDKGTDRYRMVVKPVLFGPDLRKAQGEYARAMDVYDDTYTRVVDSLNAQLQLVAAQKAFVRMVSVANMGIYNCDRYVSRREVVQVAARYKLEDGTLIRDNAQLYNLVTNKNGDKTVINLYSENIRFDVRDANSLVAILPGDLIAVMTSEEFSKLDMDAMRGSGKATFRLKLLETSFSTIDELETLLASL